MLNEQRLLDEFLELVQIDSESGDERAIADVLKQKLADLGGEFFEDESAAITGHTAGNVIAYFKGNMEGVDPILLNCHMDTVKPGAGVKPQVKDGYVYSDGTTVLGADDKAGIVAVLEAIRILTEQNISRGDIQVLFTAGEESGLAGARALDPSLLKAKLGYALDTGRKVGNVNTSAPARGILTAEIFGKKAHAGVAPETGISAIELAAHAVAKMPLGRIDEETTANIGTFTGDGALNVVTDYVKLVAEARSVNNDKFDVQMNKMKVALEETAEEFGGRVEIDIRTLYPGFSLGETEPVVEIAKRAAAKIGREFGNHAGGGGSDANMFNGYGVPMIALACGYEEIHTTSERIAICELNKLVEMTVAVITEVAAG